MMLHNGIIREDGEHVELNAVHKGCPGMLPESLVGLSVDTNSRVMSVHLLGNLIPLGLHFS